MSEASTEHFLEEVAFLLRSKRRDVRAEVLNTWRVLESLGYTTEKLLMEVRQPCSKLLSHCVWQKKKVACDSIFKLTKYSEGFCCSFNYDFNKTIQFEWSNE